MTTSNQPTASIWEDQDGGEWHVLVKSVGCCGVDRIAKCSSKAEAVSVAEQRGYHVNWIVPLVNTN